MSISTTRPLKNLPSAADVAAEFCRIINKWLTPAELREVVRHNRAAALAGDGSVCATHDYTDPNEAMLEAFSKFKVSAASQRFMDHHTDLWTQAWDLAKAAEFDCDRLPVVVVNLEGWLTEV